MKGRQQGFVLISIILLLGMVSLLLISQLEQLFKQHKVLNQYLQKEKHLQLMEQGIYQLASQGLQNSSGEMTLQKQTFFYQIEDLGVFPCLRIVSFQKSLPSRHWLIRLQSRTLFPRTMQLRLAKSSETDSPACKKNLRWIKEGLQSWHDEVVRLT